MKFITPYKIKDFTTETRRHRERVVGENLKIQHPGIKNGLFIKNGKTKRMSLWVSLRNFFLILLPSKTKVFSVSPCLCGEYL
jgi:hypothetical protein